MGQGIYWVQRHLANSHRQSRGMSREATARFNEKNQRIGREFHKVFDKFSDKNGHVPVRPGSKLDEALDEYNDLRSFINDNIDSATHADLSKMATRVKRILVELAKERGIRYQWDARRKILRFDSEEVDLS